ncbi:MAG: hypothetical protein ACTSQJ_17675, partial [Promethearchaeota archaeon]
MTNVNMKRRIYSILFLTILIIPVFFILFSPLLTGKNQGSYNFENTENTGKPKSNNNNKLGPNDFELKTEWINTYANINGSNLPFTEIYNSLIGDFNGDGSDDIILIDSENLWVIDVNGTIIYQELLIPGKIYTDIDIGNLSDSPGVDIILVANDSYTIRSYPGIDVATVAGTFYYVDIANIDPNNPYDEIILTNYSISVNPKPSTVYCYNATG